MMLASSTPSHASQNLQRSYAENALLPTISWENIFTQQTLSHTQKVALDTIYQHAVPVALQVFKKLNLDVFSANAYHPQGLGLFDQLSQQEDLLLDSITEASNELAHDVRHQIWSMLLRGGAVLVFKAWLGLVKTGTMSIDLAQFDEVSDLLWGKVKPEILAKRLNVDVTADLEHGFLIYEEIIFLEKFNCIETATLFVALKVCDPVYLSLRDEKIAALFIRQGLIQAEQVEELQCALNPLHCNLPVSKQEYLV